MTFAKIILLRKINNIAWRNLLDDKFPGKSSNITDSELFICEKMM